MIQKTDAGLISKLLKFKLFNAPTFNRSLFSLKICDKDAIGLLLLSVSASSYGPKYILRARNASIF